MREPQGASPLCELFFHNFLVVSHDTNPYDNVKREGKNEPGALSKEVCIANLKSEVVTLFESCQVPRLNYRTVGPSGVNLTTCKFSVGNL